MATPPPPKELASNFEKWYGSFSRKPPPARKIKALVGNAGSANTTGENITKLEEEIEKICISDDKKFDTFHLFPRLPIELRLKIWGEAAMEPKVFEIFSDGRSGWMFCRNSAPIPSSLRRVNKEAREQYLHVKMQLPSKVQKSLSLGTYGGGIATKLFFDERSDILALDSRWIFCEEAGCGACTKSITNLSIICNCVRFIACAKEDVKGFMARKTVDMFASLRTVYSLSNASLYYSSNGWWDALNVERGEICVLNPLTQSSELPKMALPPTKSLSTKLAPGEIQHAQAPAIIEKLMTRGGLLRL